MPQSLVLEHGSGLDALSNKQTNKQTKRCEGAGEGEWRWEPRMGLKVKRKVMAGANR